MACTFALRSHCNNAGYIELIKSHRYIPSNNVIYYTVKKKMYKTLFVVRTLLVFSSNSYDLFAMYNRISLILTDCVWTKLIK